MSLAASVHRFMSPSAHGSSITELWELAHSAVTIGVGSCARCCKWPPGRPREAMRVLLRFNIYVASRVAKHRHDATVAV